MSEDYHTAYRQAAFIPLVLERVSYSQNQNKVLGMSSYPIETSARNLPDFSRKLIPRQLLAQTITVVTWVHTSQMGTKFGVNSWICMTFHSYVLPHFYCTRPLLIGSWRHTSNSNVYRQLISGNLVLVRVDGSTLMYLRSTPDWVDTDWDDPWYF